MHHAPQSEECPRKSVKLAIECTKGLGRMEDEEDGGTGKKNY